LALSGALGGVNPYAFFVGCPRSGTTLLGRMGDAHPDLAVIHETRWLARWYQKRIGVTSEGYVTPELVDRLPGYRRFKVLEIEPDNLARLYWDREPVRYAEFVSMLFDRLATRREKRLAGDKTPRYVRSVPTLSELWPHARFVHLIRDGRDVCLSVLDWGKGASNFSTWDEDPISTTALWWEWQVRLGREAGALLRPDRYHEVRYESLVADPEAECDRLCAFLGLANDPAMVRFHEGRVRADPGLDAKRSWRPATPGLRTWRRQMAPSDVARFEAAAGDLLEELGYDRGATSLPGGMVEQAVRVRTAFADDLRARRRPAPNAWRSVVA
jgi:hypothetical protein